MNDEKAFNLIMEIVQLSKSGKPYKHLLPELKELLKTSKAAQSLVNKLCANLQNLA